MTIDNQIRDQKLQYDINRTAAKMSALSSGKINKYESLTGKEILSSNQKEIIKQTKFTYSSLGKAFEKQTKTIKDQRKKQIDALNTLKPKETKAINDNKFDDKEKSLKYKEIYDELSNQRIGEIYKISNQIDFNHLTYYFKDKNKKKKNSKDKNIYAINFLNF